MPHSLKFPRVGSAVVPLVSARNAVVHEFVSNWIPSLAAVVGTLHLLPEPATGLRRVQPIRIHRRSLNVIQLPAAEVGSVHLPMLSLPIRRQDERALACPHQNPYFAHRVLLLILVKESISSYKYRAPIARVVSPAWDASYATGWPARRRGPARKYLAP